MELTTKWQQTGPISPGGTVWNISGTEQIWLATEAGIFIQAEAEDNAWIPLASGQPLPQINALVADGQAVLAADAQGRIVYSFNGGQNWYQGEQISSTGEPVTWLAMAPNYRQTGVALAATDGGGILRTTDGGRKWQPANFGLQDFSVQALATAPEWERREIIFAATTHALYRSPNGGRGWKRFDKGLEEVVVQSLAVSPTFDKDRTIFAGTETGGVFRSTNGGKVWRPIRQGLPEEDGEFSPVNALWLHPDFAGSAICVAALGNGQIFRSQDGGDSWQKVASPGAAVMCLGGTETDILAGLHKKGLLKSTDAGQSWEPIPAFSARAVTRLYSSSNNSGLFSYGPLGQTWISNDTGQNWESLSLPGDIPILALAAAGTAGQETCLLVATAAGLLRTEDRGESWQAVLPNSEVLSIHFSATFAEDNKVWVGTSTGDVQASADGGKSWEVLPAPAPQPGRPVVAISLLQGLLSVATFAPDSGQVTLWRSSDFGESWQQWQQVTASRPSAHVNWVGQTAIVCVDRRCWRSSGTGWERVLDTEQPIVRLARLPAEKGLLLLTARQVFHSTDGVNWSACDEGLPEQQLLDFALTPGEDGGQIASILTTGGVIWQRKF